MDEESLNSMPKVNRKMFRKGVRSRQEESNRTKDSWGSGKNFFDQNKIKEITFFEIKEGNKYLIDILPYVAGENDPYMTPDTLQEERGSYWLDVWIHRNVGVNDDKFICLAKTYGEPCPICEDLKVKRKQENLTDKEKNELNANGAKRRSVYAIWDRNNEKKGVQVWDVSHFLMEKALQDRIVDPKTGETIFFADPDEGKHIHFKVSKKGDFLDITGHTFVDRDDPIPDKILEKVPTLDELIYIPTYKEVAKAYFNSVTLEEKEEESEVEVEEEEDIPFITEKDEEKPQRKSKVLQQINKKNLECPVEDGEIGKDINEFDHCSDCELWDECYELAEKIQEKDEEEEGEEEEEKPQKIEEKRKSVRKGKN